MIDFIKRILGVDIHVLFTLAFRGWAIIAGAITTIAIPSFLSPAEQGFYYAFASVLTLQIFFELGLSQVIIQLVSHDIAHLKFDDKKNLSGDAGLIARLSDFRRKLNLWYRWAAIGFTVLVGIGGWLFFHFTGRNEGPDNWLAIWFCLVSLTAMNLYLSPALAFVEGAGRVAEISRLRLIQSFIGFCLFWLLLALRFGLLSSLAVPTAAVVVSCIWMRRERRNWSSSDKSTDLARVRTFSWRSDIFPLQWRIAVSWICGYFVFNLFTPVVFASHGSIEAGRLGLGIAIFSAASSLGLSWISSKIPQLSMHISKGEWELAGRLHAATLLRAATLTILTVSSLVFAIWMLSRIAPSLANRVADVWSALWLAVAAVVNVIIFGMAAYMRAHREEPMVTVSAVSAVLTIGAVWLGVELPISTLMAFYAGIAAVITLPWTFALLLKYRARHKQVVKRC